MGLSGRINAIKIGRFVADRQGNGGAHDDGVVFDIINAWISAKK